MYSAVSLSLYFESDKGLGITKKSAVVEVITSKPDKRLLIINGENTQQGQLTEGYLNPYQLLYLLNARVN